MTSDPVLSGVRSEDTARIQEIRRRLEAVQAAARDNEVDIWNRAHHAIWDDTEYLLDALSEAQQEIARLREALEGLRDYFSFGLYDPDHKGQRINMAPRCPPSVWKEIRSQVDAALAAPPSPETRRT